MMRNGKYFPSFYGRNNEAEYKPERLKIEVDP